MKDEIVSCLNLDYDQFVRKSDLAEGGVRVRTVVILMFVCVYLHADCCGRA